MCVRVCVCVCVCKYIHVPIVMYIVYWCSVGWWTDRSISFTGDG